MTRTPVVKREPVAETNSADGDITEEHVEAFEEENAVAVKREPVPVKPLDEDGYRECAREGCINRFKPRSLVAHDTDATEYYCSTDCAVAARWKRDGYGKPPTGRSGRDEKKPLVDARERAEKDAKKEMKYGPVRGIVEVIREEGKRQVVKLDCGHERKVGKARKRARCRKCRVIEATAPQEKIRVEVAEKKPKREPVKAKTEKKTRRTPVKPPKKRGRRRK